jgi:aspartyl-tRNA(Asn)/glutamyl-tRNA(Gln) amidotransferase subunit B
MSGAYANPMAKDGLFKGIRIQQVHLEEDPARYDPETGIIDYNRCGTPLVEIVTEPDFTSKEQVRKWLEQLRLHLDYVNVLMKDLE